MLLELRFGLNCSTLKSTAFSGLLGLARRAEAATVGTFVSCHSPALHAVITGSLVRAIEPHRPTARI